MKKNIISMNLYKRKRNKISDIEEKDERNSSNFSDIKNDEVLIIQTIKRKVKNKDNKITFSSKEMTTTDQNENTSNQKNSSTTYNINFSPDSFRFQHKSPYSFYQQWINQPPINDDQNKINTKERKSSSLIDNKNITSENNKKNKKCCLIF